MKELSESLELAEENERYRELCYMLKNEIARIRREYFLGAVGMNENSINEIDTELETLSVSIENVLF